MATRKTRSNPWRYFAIVLAIVGLTIPLQQAAARKIHQHFVEIDPKAPLAELLPTPPKTLGPIPSYTNEDLVNVRELMFGEPIAKTHDSPEKEIAYTIAKINHLNKNDPDAFVQALIANRADLRGLPFRLGHDSRTAKEEFWFFRQVVGIIHRDRFAAVSTKAEIDTPPPNPEFWTLLDSALFKPNRSELDPLNSSHRPEIERGAIAGLMQILGPGSAEERVQLARFLATLKHRDAGAALTKLALFAPEENVRAAAIDGLRRRPAAEYEQSLMQGFRYPLPVVAKRAALALVETRNRAVLAELVSVLEQPDPRAPEKRTEGGAETITVREVIRVNHHRNCLLCHAPITGRADPEANLTAPIPLPNERLALPNERGYRWRGGAQNTFVRQDFSLMMNVDNAKPWPALQRFDFLVQTRVLTKEEADQRMQEMAKATPPHHEAARFALRSLIGREPAESTAAGWRALLKQK